MTMLQSRVSQFVSRWIVLRPADASRFCFLRCIDYFLHSTIWSSPNRLQFFSPSASPEAMLCPLVMEFDLLCAFSGGRIADP